MPLTSTADNGMVIYSASTIGKCTAALVYDRLGITGEPPPPNIQRAYNQGNDNEQLILDKLWQQKVWQGLTKDQLDIEGYKFGTFNKERGVDYSHQVSGTKIVAGKYIVSCHVDGIAELVNTPNIEKYGANGLRRITEVKAFGDGLWKKFKADKSSLGGIAEYQWQISVQMITLGLPLLFVVGHKNKDGVVYEIDHTVINTPPISWGQMVGKIMKVEKAVSLGKLDDVPECDKPLMYPCPFYKFHDEKVLVSVDSAGVETDLFDSLCAEYIRHRDEGKVHDDRKRELGKELLGLMEGHSEPLKSSKFEVSVVIRNSKGTLDEKLMRDEGYGMIMDRYRGEGSSSASVRVNAIGD